VLVSVINSLTRNVPSTSHNVGRIRSFVAVYRAAEASNRIVLLHLHYNTRFVSFLCGQSDAFKLA